MKLKVTRDYWDLLSVDVNTGDEGRDRKIISATLQLAAELFDDPLPQTATPEWEGLGVGKENKNVG